MSVLAAIAVLALLIVVHELGHFLAARLQGIRVNRFSIGFGPALWKYQGPETEYALRAIPLGGYVGFPDDDPESGIDPRDPDLLCNRPVLDRAIVICAGVAANLLFAWLVLIAQFSIVGVPSGINAQPGILVPQLMGQNTAAAVAGLQAGDLITAAEGRAVGLGEPGIRSLIQTIQENPNQPLQLSVERGKQTLNLTLIPRLGEDGKGRIGVQLAPNGSFIYRRATSLREVLKLASNEFEEIIRRTLQGFKQLVTHFSETAPQVSGPVKIVEWGASLAESDSGSLFLFAAFVSVNLAVINSLPLPALDGGQLLLVLIEGVLGKPLPDKIQYGFMQTGLVLLLGLGLFLIVRDTTQLTWVQQFLQQ
jgi:membrane-associated protease RseP (regulator of RpoE activity)